MVKNVKEFIENNVRKGLIKRDFFIGDGVDKEYLQPLAKAWNDYSIRKRDIIFLAILIAHKYATQIKKDSVVNPEKAIKSGKPIDMGRLGDFTDEELTFLISILISKYGLNEIVNNIGDKWGELRFMAEQGIKILYSKVYKEKTIDTEIFNTILNLDEELEI